MRALLAVCVINVLTGLGFADAGACANPPIGCTRFDCFLAATSLKKRPAKPNYKNVKEAKNPHFIETVELTIAKGANFAGDYILVQVSCGTGCAAISVVSAKTGEIFSELPFGEVHFGPLEDPYGEVAFRRDSRLLVIEGRVEGVSRKPIKAYYQWCDQQFRLLRSRSIR